MRALLCFALLTLWLAFPCSAKEYLQRVSQMGHSVWRTQDGDFAGPNAIARARDGYMWIGTSKGLVRFDGARFVRWNDFGAKSIATWSIEALVEIGRAHV